MPVDLLDNAAEGLATQHDAGAALVNFQLVQGGLGLPAVGVERRQF